MSESTIQIAAIKLNQSQNPLFFLVMTIWKEKENKNVMNF